MCVMEDYDIRGFSNTNTSLRSERDAIDGCSLDASSLSLCLKMKMGQPLDGGMGSQMYG